MKNLIIIFAAALISGLFASCISDQETAQEIYQKDLAKIDAYLDQTDYQFVDFYQDEATGIVILWEYLSYSGVVPENDDSLYVDYTGMLLDESVFDTSVEAVARENGIYSSERDYEPLEYIYGYNTLISGVIIGLSKMEEGDRARVIMPSYYGYGNTEISSQIPANSVLIFDLDLKEIDKD
ncbi:FKBP-type peptidyl-prolyl cis-trans isomerase [Echinicola sp. 20G]|uniref:FKBP-type peptidyl-prolyl cis-trans isomerase n=1 Tax=Echinicola sp. 20G TaxID=2781961 RepID=UPI001910B9A2|nr:FKBP-type peptidyl-prolyl cis-trans isomerase [Echinicola sp. 20G]